MRVTLNSFGRKWREKPGMQKRRPLKESKWKERCHKNQRDNEKDSDTSLLNSSGHGRQRLEERALTWSLRHRVWKQRWPQRVFLAGGPSLRMQWMLPVSPLPTKIPPWKDLCHLPAPTPRTENYIFFLLAVFNWPSFVHLESPGMSGP